MQATHALDLPFKRRDCAGSVSVTVVPVNDAESVGFQLLPLPFALDRTTGFPACTATVLFDQDGYAGFLGWLQFLTTTPIGDRPRREIDLMPNQYGSGVPWLFYGLRPTFFDAPANPDRSDETWEASTFLAYCPDVVHSKRLVALAGFSWGYTLTDGRPTIHPPRSLEQGAVITFAAALAAECPEWHLTDH